MLELKADLWEIPCDARVISTNGSVNRFGHAVLGRGCALEAKQRYPELSLKLGVLLRGHNRNHVYMFKEMGSLLVTFPVKHQWHERADITLIRWSADELVEMTHAQGWKRVALPRVGCGNGKLSWTIVKPVIERILDDRFTVCSFLHEG
jgi:hypothetical protein